MKKEKKLKKVVEKFLDDIHEISEDDHEVISILIAAIDIFTEHDKKHRPCLLRHASDVIQKIEENCCKHGEVWH